MSFNIRRHEQHVPEELKELLMYYPEDQVKTLLNNKDKLDKVITAFGKMDVGNVSKASISMVCNTKTCPHKSSCVLNKHGLAPEGSPCPIEAKIIAELEASLIKDLQVDASNVVDMEMLYDYLDAKILDMRTSGMLSDGQVMQEIVTNTPTGSSSKFEIMPSFQVKSELKKIKQQIIDAFVATRRAKRKYGLTDNRSEIERQLDEAMKRAKDGYSED